MQISDRSYAVLLFAVSKLNVHSFHQCLEFEEDGLCCIVYVTRNMPILIQLPTFLSHKSQLNDRWLTVQECPRTRLYVDSTLTLLFTDGLGRGR